MSAFIVEDNQYQLVCHSLKFHKKDLGNTIANWYDKEIECLVLIIRTINQNAVAHRYEDTPDPESVKINFPTQMPLCAVQLYKLMKKINYQCSEGHYATTIPTIWHNIMSELAEEIISKL